MVKKHSSFSVLRDDSRGMTLIEILAVIVLLGLLMTIVGRGIFGQADSAKAQLNRTKMEKLRGYINQYKLQYNSYPSKLDDLITASADVQKSGELFTPLASKDDVKDVWNYDYIYKSENSGRSFSLTSLGSDGVTGGDGAKQDVTLGP